MPTGKQRKAGLRGASQPQKQEQENKDAQKEGNVQPAPAPMPAPKTSSAPAGTSSSTTFSGEVLSTALHVRMTGAQSNWLFSSRASSDRPDPVAIAATARPDPVAVVPAVDHGSQTDKEAPSTRAEKAGPSTQRNPIGDTIEEQQASLRARLEKLHAEETDSSGDERERAKLPKPEKPEYQFESFAKMLDAHVEKMKAASRAQHGDDESQS